MDADRSSLCDNCPLRADADALCISPPERADRLKMLAASCVPIPCHYFVDPVDASAALLDGRDWRFDTRITVPRRAIPSNQF